MYVINNCFQLDIWALKCSYQDYIRILLSVFCLQRIVFFTAKDLFFYIAWFNCTKNVKQLWLARKPCRISQIRF
jgi:hypothetical protein